MIVREGLDPLGNTWTQVCGVPRSLLISQRFPDRQQRPDEAAHAARQLDVNNLPDEVLPFLYGSRYCDTQRLTNLAWSLFGPIAGG